MTTLTPPNDVLRGRADGRPTACVVGGGIAGVAAAVRLADAGWKVTLLESRKYLGGRATSHADPRTGEPLDNCQHVLLRCCTTMVDLLERLAVSGDVAWHDRLYFLDERGRRHVMRAAPLPSPAHLAPSLLSCGFLSARAKLAVARAMVALMREPPPPDDMTFAEWLCRHGQPQEAVSRFWSVVVVSALNETPDRASAAMAAKVFRDAFLGPRNAYEVGVPRVPLVRLYQRVGEVLRRAGGEARVGTGVDSIDVEHGRVTGVQCADGMHAADAYVCALPPERLDKVFAPAARAEDERLSAAGRLCFSPIVGIHLWFDRRVLDRPFAALVGSPLHWVFDRGIGPEGGQRLHGVTSAAREWADLPREEVVRRASAELHRYAPASAGARLVRAEVFKERRATFSPSPGAEALRPATTGAVRNLYLAGDYCRTGWPATMEGAARSGYLAADAAIRSRKAVVA